MFEPVVDLPDGYAELYPDGPDGAKYLMSPLDPKVDFQLARERLAERKRNPLGAVAEEIERHIQDVPISQREEVKARLYKLAYEDVKKHTDDRQPTRRELAEWMDTEAGGIFVLWLSFRKQHPDITEATVRDIVYKIGLTRILEARERSNAQLVERAKAKQVA